MRRGAAPARVAGQASPPVRDAATAGPSAPMRVPDDAAASDRAAVLDRAVDEIERADRADLAARVRQERRRADDPVCTVLVVGEFKKGKSALINALLNARVCPVDPLAATAVPTVVRSGAELRVRAVERAADAAPPDDGADRRRAGSTPGTTTPTGSDEAASDPLDGAGTTERTITLAELSQATDRHSDGTPVGIQSAIVELPRQLLAQGLVLIDTPGVNGGLTATHAAATLRTLAHSDAVVFVTDASQELTAPELDFFRQATRMCPNIVVALTKIDFYPEWRRILALDREHLRRAGIDVEVFPLAAPLRHRGVRTGDRDVDLASGYPQLAAYLRHHVIGRKGQLGLRAAAAAARQGLEQVRSGVSTEHDALADPAHVRELRDQLAQAKQRATRLRDTAAGWQHLLADTFGDLASDVDADLTTRLRGLRDEADERIGQVDPAAVWPELQAWLRQRTNEEAVEHFVVVRQLADRVVADIADRFETQIDDLGLYANLAPDIADRGIEARDAEFQQLSRGQVALTALRGSSGGVVITSLVGVLLGPFNIALAAVVPPLAGVAAVVFARSTLAATRDAQRKANRAAATKAVRQYLEQVELITRKDSRDTVRRINQRLRNYLRVRAAELVRTAQQNLEATAKAVKADHTSDTRRLEQLRADLRRIDGLIADLDGLLDESRARPAGGART